jgi:hypothetical protein
VARALALLFLCACAHGPPAKPGQLYPDVVFTQPSPLASNAEIARRMLTPLTQKRGAEVMASRLQTFRDQPVDVSKERFTVYVPSGEPPKEGYGLLVFVAPWETPTKPNYWRPPLDKHHLLFVSATSSGNDTKVYDRRLPLALLAYENMRARYPINPDRVYIGGLSGGSRVAQMTALGYADVFRGALLNAGSDPIGGSQGIHLPAAELFEKFQRMRIVFITGEHDEDRQHEDIVARDSMRDRCVFDTEIRIAPRLGHESLDAPSLNRALDDLDRRGSVDEGKLRQCNERLSGEINARLDAVRADIAKGDRQGARDRLNAVDNEYGGLAAKGIVRLDDELSSVGR